MQLRWRDHGPEDNAGHAAPACSLAQKWQHGLDMKKNAVKMILERNIDINTIL